MEIWQFNDPVPLRPFFKILDAQSPTLTGSARRLLSPAPEVGRQDLVRLARGLVDTRPDVRQAVRVLIFSPPIEEEVAHFRMLVKWMPDWLPTGWYEHRALRNLVVELVSSTTELGKLRPLATILEYLVKNRLPSWRREVGFFSASLEPQARRSLLSMVARRLPSPLRPGLKRMFLETETLTLAELGDGLVTAVRLSSTGAHRYCRTLRSLSLLARSSILPKDPNTASGFSEDLDRNLSVLHWGRRDSRETAFLDRLISYQANELAEVFRLAMKVSQKTKRVVLTLHNASLGAATGWGAPSFRQQLPAEAASFFYERVNSLYREVNTRFSAATPPVRGWSLRERVDNLFLLWAKRLVAPRLLQTLWTLRVSLLLNGLAVDEWRQLFIQAEELLAAKDCQLLTGGSGMAITLVQPKTARQKVEEILLWHRMRKQSHAQFFSFLWALLETGHELLRSDRLDYFVLPIIDKFFISSRRDQDLAYLPLFVQLADLNNCAPLFLLIDDTSRGSQPSLQLAIEHWRKKFDFQGLGIFGEHRNAKSSPLETILASCDAINLFALRPLSQVHNPIPLEILLSQRPGDFLTPAGYDSSWKDNLPFLYHGTQVAPFSGEVKQPEQYYPALLTSEGPMAFGTYYRCRLRQLGLHKLGFSSKPSRKGAADSPLDVLWSNYAQLANLL